MPKIKAASPVIGVAFPCIYLDDLETSRVRLVWGKPQDMGGK